MGFEGYGYSLKWSAKGVRSLEIEKIGNDVVEI